MSLTKSLLVVEISTNPLNAGIMDLWRFETSVNEAAISGIYKDYVVKHRQTHAHTQTDYYNPLPTLRLITTVQRTK